jgi:hypoxanthine phosphoribosyltransferase
MFKIAHIDPDQFLVDTLALGRKVYQSGFRPKHAISIWRGGTPVGLGVDAYFRAQGVYLNHTTVATESYKGIGKQEEVIVKGLEHVIKVICPEDGLLIVDDVYESGRTIQKIVETLRTRARKNAPDKIVVATVHAKPDRFVYSELPLISLHERAGNQWIDYPHELADLYQPDDAGEALIKEKDPQIWDILNAEGFPIETVETDEPQIYLTARELLYDALRLGVNIARDDSFYPDFLLAIWPGGISAGLPVHEVIKYLNRRSRSVKDPPDHISINTTRSHASYHTRVIGVRYLEDNIANHHNILIIDTTFRSGRMVNDIILKLKTALRRNLSHKRIRVASIYYNPNDRSTWTVKPVVTEPDYYLKIVDKDVVYPQSFYRLSEPRTDLRRLCPMVADLLYGQQ